MSMSGERLTLEQQFELAKKAAGEVQKERELELQKQQEESDQIFQQVRDRHKDIDFDDPTARGLIAGINELMLHHPSTKSRADAAEMSVRTYKMLKQQFTPQPPPVLPGQRQVPNAYASSLLQSSPSNQQVVSPVRSQQPSQGLYEKGAEAHAKRLAEYHKRLG